MKNFAYIYETFFFFSLKIKKQYADKAEQQLSRFFSPASFVKKLTTSNPFQARPMEESRDFKATVSFQGTSHSQTTSGMLRITKVVSWNFFRINLAIWGT